MILSPLPRAFPQLVVESAVTHSQNFADDGSSLPDYLGVSRPESSILDRAAREIISDALPHFSEVLADAKEYYEQLGI